MNNIMKKVFTLHTGTWDSHRLTGLFSTKKKAEAFVKKFGITDAPIIEETELDKLDDLVKSNKTPYLATCRKSGKIIISTREIYDFYQDEHVRFSYGIMYYFVSAINDNEAIKKTETKRKENLKINWNEA